MPNHFADRLCDAVRTKRTSLVVGLDPVYNRLPAAIKDHRSMNDESDAAAAVDAIFDFCTQTLRIIAPLVPAVKINIAYFEKYLGEGIETYYGLISEAEALGLEIIGDVKRGDIGHTAEEYAEASAMGWRCFRVRKAHEPILPNEIMCPASKEGGLAVLFRNPP